MQHRCDNPAPRRRGSVLLEFALISLVFYILIAAVVTFGFILYAAQGTQQAAEVAAREISQTPLPADTTLEDVLYGNAYGPTGNPQLLQVRQRVFDQHYLVLNVDNYHGFGSLQELIAALPIVNQQLVPLMITDRIENTTVLRYPGAVFRDDDSSDDPSDPVPTGYLVTIPLVTDRDPNTGIETIEWVRPIEEIRASGSTTSPFQITSPQRGIVALRINYPVQSSMMTSYRANPAGPFEPNIANPNRADDDAVTAPPPPGTLITPDPDSPNTTYSGRYGLGRQEALGSQQLTGGIPVRPYRRVISAQAIFRREVFE